MASTAAATDDTQASDIDDQVSRPSPRNSPEGRRNGKAVSARPRVSTHLNRAPSPQDDDRTVSSESDNDLPADPVPAPVQRPHVEGWSSARSPVRQKPPVANPPAGHRDQFAGPQFPNRSRPSSFAGAPADDPRRHSAAMPNGRHRPHQQERPNGRPSSQGHPPFSPSGPWPKTRAPPSGKPTNPQNRRSHPLAAEPRVRAPSPPEPNNPRNPVNRLESPSIAKSVLQPLEHKIIEYDRLMHEAQDQMAQLDEELRQLHERRRQAEEHFLEAKAKHDDYERQHVDVERALRGELDNVMLPQHHQAQQQQQPMVHQATPPPQESRMELAEGYERRPTSNPTSKHSSRTRKMGTRDRIKMSLFGTI